MKKLTRPIFLAILTALLSSGCASLTKTPYQRVPVSSVPSGARVLDNGQVIGITPMNASLSRKVAHTITIQKPGFHSESVTLLTVTNEAANAYVRFGIDEVSGAYSDLTPDKVEVELDPLILPAEVSDEPFSELAAKIVEVDEQLASGKITAEDHRYILARLFEFYQP